MINNTGRVGPELMIYHVRDNGRIMVIQLFEVISVCPCILGFYICLISLYPCIFLHLEMI
jgi:hypothetical protein